ncbi:MAG: nuclear transport factor 2 family protein [Trebonia sp.]
MTDLPDSWRAALLRAEVDAVLADWAWHLDHGDYDALVELFTENALFITGTVELRGRSAIKNRYSERVVVRSTRHTYSGLRVGPVPGDSGSAAGDSGPAGGGRPARVRARSTWVNFAANAPAPVDDVGVYLVADFDDVLTRCDDDRWRISERRITGVFRDPSRAPVGG